MHEDVKSNPKTDRRFGKYKALWGAYADFMVTLKKVKLAPQRYECAAPRCEVTRLRGRTCDAAEGRVRPSSSLVTAVGLVSNASVLDF